MDKLVQTLGITGLSKSQVSEMSKDLDSQVEAVRTRPLDEGPYRYVEAGALVLKVREHGRVVKVAAMVATGINHDGYREILGVRLGSVETKDGRWDVLAFTGFPQAVWRKVWSNKPNEQINKKILRCTDVVGVFLNSPAVARLVGAVLAEQLEEWSEARCYVSLESLTATDGIRKRIDSASDADREVTETGNPAAIAA